MTLYTLISNSVYVTSVTENSLKTHCQIQGFLHKFSQFIRSTHSHYAQSDSLSLKMQSLVRNKVKCQQLQFSVTVSNTLRNEKTAPRSLDTESLMETELLNQRSSITGLSKCPSKWIFLFSICYIHTSRLIILITKIKFHAHVKLISLNDGQDSFPTNDKWRKRWKGHNQGTSREAS